MGIPSICHLRPSNFHGTNTTNYQLWGYTILRQNHFLELFFVPKVNFFWDRFKPPNRTCDVDNADRGLMSFSSNHKPGDLHHDGNGGITFHSHIFPINHHFSHIFPIFFPYISHETTQPTTRAVLTLPPAAGHGFNVAPGATRHRRSNLEKWDFSPTPREREVPWNSLDELMMLMDVEHPGRFSSPG